MAMKLRETIRLLVSTIGSGILLLSLVLHIVCLATAYFTELTDSGAKAALSKLGYRNVTHLNNVTIGMNYGIWEFCVDAGSDSNRGTFCYQFGSSSPNGSLLQDSPNKSDDLIESPGWLKECQILSIVGLLVGALGLIAFLAWLPSKTKRMQHLFLFGAAFTSLLGGLLIISCTIVFAAENTIEFYAKMNIDSFFFDPNASEQWRALAVTLYNREFETSWGFALDIVAGCLCLLAAAPFTFAALQRTELDKIKVVALGSRDEKKGVFIDETKF